MGERRLDVLFRGARVHDGDRFLPEGTVVGVAGREVVVCEPGREALAAEVVRADGLVLAPAFIDVHNHGDLNVLTRDGVNLLSQGAGTVIVGHCGFSPWGPVASHALFLEDGTPPFASARDYWDALAGQPLPVNVASMAGLGALLPLDGGAPERLEDALEAGCLGLSVGLAYEGQNRVGEDALIRLGRVLARCADRWGGICWHLRDYGAGLLEAVREAIRVHEATGVPCHVCHLKRTSTEHPDDVDAALALMAPYPEVAADMYPYVEGFSTLALLATAAQKDLGPDASLGELAEASCRQFGPDAWADVMLVGGVADELRGTTLQDVADSLGGTGREAFLHVNERFPGALVCFMRGAHPSIPRTVLSDPHALLGSDGHVYGAGDDGHHPRAFGAFARFIRLCREEGWMDLEAALHKLTGRAADRFGLTRRGRLRDGCFADLCLFDPEAVEDTATFRRSNALARGVEMVVLNGTKVFEAGRVLARGGTALRAPLG